MNFLDVQLCLMVILAIMQTFERVTIYTSPAYFSRAFYAWRYQR